MVKRSEVYLIDDDEAIRRSLSFLLRTAGIVAHAYESATEFLQFVDQLAPGCIVTDVRMPGLSGLELVKRLTEKGIRQPVIVITGHGDIPLAVEAMKSGAVDFLEKPFDSKVFLAAVRAALETDDHHAQQAEAREKFKGVMSSLTAREKQVLRSVVEGKPNKAIANELDISPRTVEVHRANVMSKAGASSLSELVRMTTLGSA